MTAVPPVAPGDPPVDRRRVLVAVGVATVVALVAAVALVTGRGDEAATPPASPGASTTGVPPSTAPPVPIWPLRGTLADPVAMRTPAFSAKVDNHPSARPHAGLNAADLVYEVRVEGITRFISVFHSELPDRVGPVRSGRSSDIDLMFGLGRPLYVWSGGNPGVVGQVRAAAEAGGLTDAGVSSPAASHYTRDRSRSSPHNLFADAGAIKAQMGTETVGWPGPILPHAPAGHVPPGASPAAGVRIDFGSNVTVDYVWDPQRSGWDRFQVDQRHPPGRSAFVDEAGAQVAPENVVVLFVEYVPDPVDDRSPLAVTLGGGEGLALMSGTAVPVRWRRDTNRDAWNLTDGEGRPVLLGAGRTWVALPAAGGGRASVLDPAEAAGLLARRA